MITISAKKGAYTGVMAMDWQETYVSILSLVIQIYIYISVR